MQNDNKNTVRAVACDHRGDDESVYNALARATESLAESWERLGRARTIAIKFNQDLPHSLEFQGQRRQELVDFVVD